VAGNAPSSGYGVLNLKVTTPTRSRELGHSALLTFGGGNDPREVQFGWALTMVIAAPGGAMAPTISPTASS
jgi:hypothetical protein